MTLPHPNRSRVPGSIGSVLGNTGGRVPGPLGGQLPKLSVESSSVLSSLPPIALGLLAGMDKQGEQILGTWLYGGGVPHEIDEPDWADYMMEHKGLRRQIMAQLAPAVQKIADKKELGRFPFSVRFHAEFPENGDFSGYALLHGSNKDAGDFLIVGYADVSEANEPKEGHFDIELELRFVFHDIVDPNHSYTMDSIRSVAAHIFTLGSPKNYRLSIIWNSKPLAEVKPGQPIFFSGYPSEARRIVRPLPSATLDLAGEQKKWAQKHEDRIISQLNRKIAADDVKSLADRKVRLLWSFYHLAGYWGGTYRDRIKSEASWDELPRLLKQRLSKELRAELLEALNGKRPPGEEPDWPPAAGQRTLREVPNGKKAK